ncbi:hypothetical protein ACET3Z_026866 [Daucus carota]
MEIKLYDACVEGDAEKLEALMREDKLILARLSLLSCSNHTPLHLACMLGHFNLAKSLLSYKPDFASWFDSQGRSPLHLASANGYANIVQLLLQINPKMCRICDEDGRTPLHLAVMNGQHESAAELLKANSDFDPGKVLQLCVMYNRLNILVLVLGSNFADLSTIKDEKGNTVLHSATEVKRVQMIKYLVTRGEVLDLNAVNKNGLTALDIIEQMPQDVKTMEIKELLISAGSLRAKLNKGATSEIVVEQGPAAPDKNKKGVKKKNSKSSSNFPKKQPKKDKNLLVAASVIAAMAYQAALSPPGGLAAVDATTNLAPSYDTYKLKPATSVVSAFMQGYSDVFWISNTIAFMAALSVIFLYVSGARLHQRFLVWLIRLGMWITLSAMTSAYVCAVLAINPDEDIHKPGSTFFALAIGLVAWAGLIALTFVVLVFKSLSYIVRKFFTMIKRATRKKKKKKSTGEEGEAASGFSTPDTYIV